MAIIASNPSSERLMISTPSCLVRPSLEEMPAGAKMPFSANTGPFSAHSAAKDS